MIMKGTGLSRRAKTNNDMVEREVSELTSDAPLGVIKRTPSAGVSVSRTVMLYHVVILRSLVVSLLLRPVPFMTAEVIVKG